MNMIVMNKEFEKDFHNDGIIFQDGMITNSEKIFNANTALHEAYKNYSQELVTIAKKELVGIGDLISRGLTEQLPHVGITLSFYEKMSDTTPAEINMDGQAKGKDDKETFDDVGTPVPVFYKDHSKNFRHKAALESGNINITSASNAQATYAVTELMEKTLVNGNSKIVVSGQTIPGYTTFADRETYTLPKYWNGDNAATGNEIYLDVLAMVQKLRDNNFYGDYVLYIPNAYSTVLDKKYSTAFDSRTIREELLSINGLTAIRELKSLAEHNVILIQMDKRVVDVVIAQPLSMIVLKTSPTGDSFRNWAIMIHRLKSDMAGQCGICHGSKA
jgi:hypothetical protein